MRDFSEYSPEDVIFSNLRENTKRADMLREQELAHLHELAAEILSAGDLQEILASLPDRRPPVTKLHDDTLSQNTETLTALHRITRSQQSILLCSELCSLLATEKGLAVDAFFSDMEHSQRAAPLRVVYPKSGYADSAYLCFSAFLREPHASYTHSFISACEEVYNGLCDYCILPLENSTDGMLIGFLKLIVRYELKIAATCAVTSHGEGKITRFALLRRTILPIEDIHGSDYIFSLMLPYERSFELSELLDAAAFFGLRLLSVSFLPSEKSEEGRLSYISFCVEGEKLNAFLLYLSMEVPHYTPIGLYPNIHKKGKS